MSKKYFHFIHMYTLNSEDLFNLICSHFGVAARTQISMGKKIALFSSKHAGCDEDYLVVPITVVIS